MLSEDEKKRRLALLQQQQGKPVNFLESMFRTFQMPTAPKQPTAPIVQTKIPVVTNTRPTTEIKVNPPQQPTQQRPTFFQQMIAQPKTAQQIFPTAIRNVTQAEANIAKNISAAPRPLQETINKKIQTYENLRKQSAVFTTPQLEMAKQKAFSDYAAEMNRASLINKGISQISKTPQQFITEYNNLDDSGQRKIREDLTRVFTDYNSSRNPELKAIGDTAGTYLSIISAKKEDLAKAQLPEVTNKFSFGGLAKDILGSTVLSPAKLLERIGTSAQGALGVNLFAQNEADLNAGRITQEEFDRRQSQINARIASVTGSFTGEDKGLADRLARSVGTTAEAALYTLPGAGFIRMVKVPTGQVGRTIAGQTALGTGLGGLAPLGSQGLEAQPTDIIASSILGGTFQGGATALGALTQRTIARIKAKPYNELKPSELRLLQRENTVHPEDPTASPEQIKQSQAQTAQYTTTTQKQPAIQQVEGTGENYINSIANQYAEAEKSIKERYQPPGFIAKLKSLWDERYKAVELDRATKKRFAELGVPYTQLDSLDNAIAWTLNYANRAQNWMESQGFIDLFGKYGATDGGRKFNIYRLYKRDLEFAADGRGQVTNAPLDVKQKYVNEFEKANPSAQADLRQLSEKIKQKQLEATQGPDAFMTKDELMRAWTKKDGTQYQYYTPAKAALPDETLRPDVSGQNVGSIARQTVLRDMAGGELAEATFDAITDYIRNIEIQKGRTRVANIFRKRVEEGLVPGSKVVQTGEQMAELAAKRLTVKEIRKQIKGIQSRLKITSRQARTIAKELRTIKREAYAEVKKKLGKGIKGKMVPEGGPTLRNIAGLIEELFTADMATLNRLNRKFMNREPKLAAKIQEIIDLKQQLETAKAQKKQVAGEIADIRPDPTTGLQIVSGLDENGNVYRIETTPEFANLIMGFDRKQLGPIAKFFRALTSIPRFFWVGVGNPAFQLATAMFNTLAVPFRSEYGLRVYYPQSVRQGLLSLFGRSDVLDMMRQYGARGATATSEMLPGDTSAAALIAQYNTVNKLKWYTDLNKGIGFRRSFSKLNEFGGRIDRAFRTASANTAYRIAKSKNLSDEEALAAAFEAWNNALPDYSNAATFVKQVDSVVPFAAATQTGTRWFLRAYKERPAQMAKRTAVLTTGLAALYAYNTSSEAGKEFYRDMRESKRDTILDNNFIFVLPGAYKDKTTGEWQGVIKFALSPEFRPINRMIRDTFYEISEKNNIPIGAVAVGAFDFFTGKFRDSQSPLVQISSAIATGIDPKTGRQIYDATMDPGERAIAISKYLSKQLGIAGNIIGDKDAGQEFINSFVNRVYGAKGENQGQSFWRITQDAPKQFDMNKNELNEWYNTINKSKKDLLLNDIKDSKYTDSSVRAASLLDVKDPTGLSKLWRAAKWRNEQMVALGYPSNPMYELNDEQAQVLLTIQRQMGGDNKEGAKVLRDKNPWIQDYYKKSSAYWDNVFKNMPEEDRKKANLDPLGKEVPRATPELQSKLDQLDTLTSPADRAKYYEENPDITEFFNKSEQYQRFVAAAQGFPLRDEYPTPTPEVQKLIDEYNKLPKGDGPLKRDGTPSSPTRSAWIKANPSKWAEISNQWTKQDIYRVQQEGSRAIYEGVDFTEQGIKSIQDIAKSLGSSLGMSTRAAGNLWSNATPEQRQYLSTFINRVQVPSLPKITEIKAKQIKQFKIKLPSTTRRGARIKLQ